MPYLLISSVISFFVGLILGAKFYKNRDRLEKWARFQLGVFSGRKI